MGEIILEYPLGSPMSSQCPQKGTERPCTSDTEERKQCHALAERVNSEDATLWALEIEEEDTSHKCRQLPESDKGKKTDRCLEPSAGQLPL